MAPYKTYSGFAYRQSEDTNAPWIVLFVASAEELLTWSGIPRRTEGSTMGFQRIDDADRVLRAKEFFAMPPNQSPTALVLGVHPTESGDQVVRLELPRGASGPGPIPCTLTVERNPSEFSLEEAVARIGRQLETRVARDLAAHVGSADEEVDDVDEEDTDDEETAGEEDDSGVEGVGMANSVIHRLKTQLSDTAWVETNKEALFDLAKPATIIDGQHRLKGAAACERSIPFAVCALVDCSWPEQVFQFTVVNYSQKGIPDQFITANAALSLTDVELQGLQTRLDQARVKVIEYELMKVVEFDDESPFFGLINLSESKNKTKGESVRKIGYKTMVRVAREWYSASPAVLRSTVLPALYPQFSGRGARDNRVRSWNAQTWGLFFIDFWRTVRDHYQDQTSHDGNNLWTVGHSNLLIAIVLFEFQRQFFVHLNAQDDPAFYQVPAGEDPVTHIRAKLRQIASKFVLYFPPEFFGAKWGIKSLNTSAGRRALKNALDKLRETKGKYQYGKSALVTGETG